MFFKYTPTWDDLQSPAFIMIIIDHWGVSFLWPTGANPCSAKDIVSGGSFYEAGDGCDLRKSKHVILGIPMYTPFPLDCDILIIMIINDY